MIIIHLLHLIPSHTLSRFVNNLIHDPQDCKNLRKSLFSNFRLQKIGGHSQRTSGLSGEGWGSEKIQKNRATIDIFDELLLLKLQFLPIGLLAFVNAS